MATHNAEGSWTLDTTKDSLPLITLEPGVQASLQDTRDGQASLSWLLTIPGDRGGCFGFSADNQAQLL